MPTHLLNLVVACSIVLVGASCRESSAPLTKSQAIALGDAACQRQIQAIRDAPRGMSQVEVARFEHDLIEETLHALREVADGVNDPDLTEMIANIEEADARLLELTAAIERDDHRAAEEAEAKMIQAGSSAGKAAQAFGFKVCGRETRRI